MIHTLLGPRASGVGWISTSSDTTDSAVTCDDFRAAMADANEFDLEQLALWYSQAGTPVVEAEDSWDARRAVATRSDPASVVRGDRIRRCPASQGRRPLHIPVAVGLLDSRMSRRIEIFPCSSRVSPLRTAIRPACSIFGAAEQTFEFVGLGSRPIPLS